jgi:hypothetical protein
MVDVTVNYTATDNCPLTCVLTVASSEPIDGQGDGDTSPDWQVVNDHHVLLRAERSGNDKNGRTYTITTTCTDESGNAVVKTSTVFVPYSQKDPKGGTLVTNTGLNPTGGAGPVSQASGSAWISVAPGYYRSNSEAQLRFDFKSRPAKLTEQHTQVPVEFRAGKMKFKASSSDYQKLSDSKVQFRGTGKVNGESGYNFILTVIDGQAQDGGGVDKFRIKIWNDKTGEVVFDSQTGDRDDAEPTTSVGEGK